MNSRGNPKSLMVTLYARRYFFIATVTTIVATTLVSVIRYYWLQLKCRAHPLAIKKLFYAVDVVLFANYPISHSLERTESERGRKTILFFEGERKLNLLLTTGFQSAPIAIDLKTIISQARFTLSSPKCGLTVEAFFSASSHWPI